MEAAPVPCFVAMFDILGFKQLRGELGTAELHARYQRGVRPQIEHAAAGRSTLGSRNGEAVYLPDRTHSRIGFLAISDSVLFFAPNDDFTSFAQIVDASFKLARYGIASRMPFRGAIGWGDLANAGDGILIGTAIEDAYEGEATQAWAGARLTRACEAYVRQAGLWDAWQQHFDALAAGEADPKRRAGLERARARLIEAPIAVQKKVAGASTRYATEPGIAINWTVGVGPTAGARAFRDTRDPHVARLAAHTLQFETYARSAVAGLGARRD